MSSDKTVGGLLTEIADILREEVNDQKYKLEMMPVAIRELGANNFRLGKEEGIQQGYDIGFLDGQASKPFEVHKITIASDLTSGTYKFLENNAFIANNFEEPGLCIQIFRLPPYAVGNGVSYAYTGNISIPSISTGEVTKNSFMLNVRDDGVFRARVDSNVPYFDENGNLLMITSTTNGILKAGDYLVILSVAEV